MTKLDKTSKLIKIQAVLIDFAFFNPRGAVEERELDIGRSASQDKWQA